MAEDLRKEHGGLDILINNAAIAYKQAATEPFGEQAENTLKVNYWNTKRACNILYPVLKDGARVVSLSSSFGWLKKQFPEGTKMKERLASDDLTVEELDGYMKSFEEAAKAGDHQDKGFPNSTYMVSKVGISALSRIQQREFDTKSKERDIVVSHVHPGYISTGMTSFKAPNTVEEGARSSIFAALLPPKTELRGAYIWEDCSIKEWA
jgi:carbonyl reductase 1